MSFGDNNYHPQNPSDPRPSPPNRECPVLPPRRPYLSTWQCIKPGTPLKGRKPFSSTSRVHSFYTQAYPP
eukprot:1194403-Prorocentrum_minimum.AAC.3